MWRSPIDDIISWVGQGKIKRENAVEAIEQSGVLPDESQWLEFADKLLLILGCLALVVSLSFFISFNWDEFSRFHKFALIESVLAVFAVGYLKATKDTLVSQMLLIACMLSIGILMAFFGQTYQTGADPWQLFANWALLTIPLVLLGRNVALWLFWIVIVNLAAVLYIEQVGNFLYSLTAFSAIFVICSIAVVCWELLAKSRVWLDKVWAIRLIFAATAFSVSVLCGDAVLADSSPLINYLWYYLWLGTAYFFYRYVKPDLVSIMVIMVSVNCVVLTFLIKHLLTMHTSAGQLFLIGVLLLIAISLSGSHLLGCYRQIKSHVMVQKEIEND